MTAKKMTEIEREEGVGKQMTCSYDIPNAIIMCACERVHVSVCVI